MSLKFFSGCVYGKRNQFLRLFEILIFIITSSIVLGFHKINWQIRYVIAYQSYMNGSRMKTNKGFDFIFNIRV